MCIPWFSIKGQSLLLSIDFVLNYLFLISTQDTMYMVSAQKFSLYVQYVPQHIHMVLLCFILFWWYSWWIHELYLPIFFRVASLALGQSYDCPSASEVTLNDMIKIDHQLLITKLSNADTICIICGMYYMWALLICLYSIMTLLEVPYLIIVPLSVKYITDSSIPSLMETTASGLF